MRNAGFMNDPGGIETALVIRGKGGDRAAFEELVKRTARWVFVRVYVQIGDPHRTEDLVQETYLRAWSRLDSLSDPATFRAWLGSIAHGVVIDSIKHERRQKRGGLLRTLGVDDQTMLKLADANQPS